MDEPKNKGGRPRTNRGQTIGVRVTEEEMAFCRSMDPDGNAASYLRLLMDQHRLYIERLPKKEN
jgi:hypothetical protein